MQVISTMFFLGDLMDSTTNKVKKGYLDGTESQMNAGYKFPPMRKPTRLEWSKWKDFIFRNFLVRAYNIQDVPTRSHTYQPQQYNTNIEMLNNIDYSRLLMTIINSLPCVWRQVLGHIQCPQDDDYKLSNAMGHGKVIGSNDGSLIMIDTKLLGGHAYSVNLWENNNLCIVGKAPTPTSTHMTPLTTKLYGLLACTLLTVILDRKYSIQKNPTTV